MKPVQWLMLVIFLSFHNLTAQPTKINIAAAANLVPAIDSLVKDFTILNNCSVDLIFGSSGQLAAQIRNGAPYDLFLSADILFPQSLINSRHARDSVTIYAKGQLVFCTTNNDPPDNKLNLLSKRADIHLTIANPKLAPYGAQSREVLRQIGIDISKTNRLVLSRNIAQVNHFLITGAVEAGITAYSAVQSGNWRPAIRWALIDTSLYQPILQGAVITRYAEDQRLNVSRQFLQFLLSPTGIRRLTQFGYREP